MFVRWILVRAHVEEENNEMDYYILVIDIINLS